MEDINEQFIATCLFVFAAVVLLARRVYKMLNRQGGCASGGCDGCGPNASTPDNFVALETLEQVTENSQVSSQ